MAPVEAESRLNSLSALDLSIRVKVKFVFHTLLVTVKVTCSLYAIDPHLRTHHHPSLSSISQMRLVTRGSKLVSRLLDQIGGVLWFFFRIF